MIPVLRKLEVDGGDRDEIDPSRTDQGELATSTTRRGTGSREVRQVTAVGPEVLLVSQTPRQHTFPPGTAADHRLCSSSHRNAGHVPVFPGAPGLVGLKEQGPRLGRGGLAIPYSEP